MNFIDQEKFSIVTRSNLHVLICLWANWCDECKKNASLLQNYSDNNGAKVFFMDWDANKSFFESLNICGVPILLLYENGKLKQRISGALTRKDIRQIIQKINNTNRSCLL